VRLSCWRAGLGLLVCLGLLGCCAGPVFALAPEAPETKPATGVTSSVAVLHGVLNPKVVAKAGWFFAYSTGLTCMGGPVSPQEPEVEGKALPEHVEVSGLEPSRTYMACMVAVNAASESTAGSEVPFKTAAAAPVVEGESVSGVTATGGELEAVVNPNNEEASFSFEYSTQATGEVLEGSITTLNGEAALPAEYGGRAASIASGVLPAGTTFFYRVVAKNAAGTSKGAVQSFATVPAPHTDAVSGITGRTAVFNGDLTLSAVDSSYSFDYNTTGECTGGLSTVVTDAGTGAASTPVSVEATGLIPNTLYTVCMVTSNAYGSQPGAPETFSTLVAPVGIVEEHTTEVTGTSAKLQADINPGGAETTYHFEYDTTPYSGSAAHGTQTAVTPLLAADNALHPALAAIEGLAPSTEYHYRLVATNTTGTEDGPDATFRTQTAGGALALPDGRQYELVSPPEKDGAQAFGIVAENGVVVGGSGAVQASEDGSRISYLTSAPVGANPEGNAAASQILSSRSGSGWSSTDISPANPEPIPVSLEAGEPFRQFSNDLTLGLRQEPISEAAEPPVVLRDNVTGVSEALTTGGLTKPVAFEAASSDLAGILLNTNSTFASGGVWEWSAGSLSQVDIGEHGAPVAGGFLGGGFGGGESAPSRFAGRHAVSGDGSRVVWGTPTELSSRDTATGETAQVDAGPEGSGGGQFQLASADGTRVFFTDDTPLTAGAVPGSLYMFDVPHRQLSDLGPVGIQPPGECASCCGTCNGDEVLGANEAGTVLYVTSELALTETPNASGEKAVAAEHAGNMFVLREAPVGSGTWSVSFIATLSAADQEGYDFIGGEGGYKRLAHLPVRVSPDGEYFAFMSDRGLAFTTSHGLERYDNRDAVSGVPDEEVFLYHAGPEAGLVCASCDPTGARPTGVFDSGEYPGLPMDPNRGWEGHWLAAAIPQWNEAIHDAVPGGLAGYEAPLYASRVLSDAGRLFFDSAVGLVSQDVDGREDVYEFEPGGLGSCAAGGSGCVALISSGQGVGDSVFVDASVSGDDVFFITSERLVPADVDPATDMYDAHVCSAAVPCLPMSGVASAPCVSTDSCRAAQASQPGVFGVSGSATFSGAGNLHVVTVLVPKPTAAQVRAKALARELKVCRRKHGHKRAVCEARARKRFGPKAKAKVKAKAKKSGVGLSGRGVGMGSGFGVNGGRGGK
jgi:hypothetical protein